eukprot:gene1018-44_t
MPPITQEYDWSAGPCPRTRGSALRDTADAQDQAEEITTRAMARAPGLAGIRPEQRPTPRITQECYQGHGPCPGSRR